MENLGRYLVIGGVILIVLGGGVFLTAKLGLPLGRLPGDIHVERDGFSFYFPLASSILISLILTVVLNLIMKYLHR